MAFGVDDAILAAGITAGAQLLGTGANAAATAGRNKRQRRWQSAEAGKARDFAWEAWNANNFYNRPDQQMLRYEEAGLNPHLIYGQGNPGNTTSTPEYHPANVDHETVQLDLSMRDAVDVWQNVKMNKANLDRIAKLNDLADQQKANLVSENMLKNLNIIKGDLDTWKDWGIDTGISEVRKKPIMGADGFKHSPAVSYQLDAAKAEAELKHKGLTKMQSEINLMDERQGLVALQKATEMTRRTLMDQQAMNMMEARKNLILKGKEMEELVRWKQGKNFDYENFNINRDTDPIADRLLQKLANGMPAGMKMVQYLLPGLNAMGKKGVGSAKSVKSFRNY